jgi:hypothetical protein
VGGSSDRKRPDPEETVILADDGDSAPITFDALTEFGTGFLPPGGGYS